MNEYLNISQNISEYIWIISKLGPTLTVGSGCARWRNRCLFQRHKRESKAKVTESTWKYLLHPGTVDIVFVWVTVAYTTPLQTSYSASAISWRQLLLVPLWYYQIYDRDYTIGYYRSIQPFSQDNMRIHAYYVHIQGSYMHFFSPHTPKK